MQGMQNPPTLPADKTHLLGVYIGPQEANGLWKDTGQQYMPAGLTGYDTRAKVEHVCLKATLRDPDVRPQDRLSFWLGCVRHS